MNKIKVRLEHVRQLTGREHLELAFMLGYLANRQSLGQPTRFIDIVNAQDFGTATRVNNYLQRLSALDFISFVKNTQPGYEKFISVNELGYEWLQTIESDILNALGNIRSNRSH